MLNKRWLLGVISILILLVLVIAPACGGGGGKSPVPTPTGTPTITVTQMPTATATPMATPTAIPTLTTTPSPAPSGPVKIGAITSWSGPAALSGLYYADPVIKLVEKQVQDMGGILGGRDVKVVKYDNRGSVAEAQAGAMQLLYEDHVSALTLGGSSGAESDGISSFAEQNKVLYVTYGVCSGIEEGRFTISATLSYKDLCGPMMDLAVKVLKAKTAAFLSIDLSDSRERVRLYKLAMEAAGGKTVYEEYVTYNTQDYMSYLTKIKYVKPDVLVLDSGQNELLITVAKQIMEIGGWGDTKVITISTGESCVHQSGAQGWYVATLWSPGLTYPGAVKYEKDFQAMTGTMPTATGVYYYNCLWTAINAIELAGTDTDLVKIAQMARFSGKLEWDTPMGHAHYTAESAGYPQLHATMTQIQNGKLVVVPMPE
jgi:branched-chain amino acid transport system substrate-binding protein